MCADRIAVVMPVYIKDDETLKITENAIDSLGNVYLVIVDNGSDRGREYLKQMSDHYIRNGDNLGYAIAVNQGLSYLNETTDINLIAIANNDVRVSPNWQEVTREIMQDPKIYSLHFRMIHYNELFDYGNTLAKSGYERWCTQSFFVINKTKEFFLFDEDFLNSYDDWDMQFRVREKGYQTAYTDKACYQHKYSHTQELVPGREERDKKNAEIYKEKYGMYAEEQFTKMYPDQFKREYWSVFKLKK